MLHSIANYIKSNSLLSRVFWPPVVLWRRWFRFFCCALHKKIPDRIHASYERVLGQPQPAQALLHIQKLDGKILTIKESGHIKRVKPIVLSGQCSKALTKADEIKWAKRTVFELNNVQVVGGYSSNVLTKEGILISDLSPDVFGSQYHELFTRIRLPAKLHLPGKSLLITTPEASSNYSHWLFDLLPRVIAIQESGVYLYSFDHVIIDSLKDGYQKQTLELFGIDFAKCRLITKNDRFICDSVVTTTLRYPHWQYSLNPHEVKALKHQLFDPAQPSPLSHKRLWLGRSSAAHRKIRNEDELLPHLEALGFHVIEATDYSLTEQAAIFNQAEVIAGVHSSSMSNWLFCQEGTRVLEIFSPWHHDVSFWTIASLARLNYHMVCPKTPIEPDKGEIHGTRYIDFAVDIDEVASALKKLI